MKVLLVRGNPRKTGYSPARCGSFCPGVARSRGKGNRLRSLGAFRSALPGVLSLLAGHPGPMCSWRRYWGSARTGARRRGDCLLHAALLLLVSALLKTWFERTFRVRSGVVRSARGLTRNSVRFPERWRNKK